MSILFVYLVSGISAKPAWTSDAPSETFGLRFTARPSDPVSSDPNFPRSDPEPPPQSQTSITNDPFVFYDPMTSSVQYYSHDNTGQAIFGYAYPGQMSENSRDVFGNQVGSYTFMNPEGKEIRVSYVADSQGFRVLSNDLPIAPEETPEVAAARAEHMAAHEAIQQRIYAISTTASPELYNDLTRQARARKNHSLKTAHLF